MSRATKVLAGTTILGFVTSLWLYIDNQSLRDEVAAKRDQIAEASPRDANPAEEGLEAMVEAARQRTGKFTAPTPPPKLETGKKESRLERRNRRTEEFAAMFGRAPGETEEQWRERVAPLIAAGLMKARLRTNDNRRIAEEKANVTPEQSKQLDDTMLKYYDDVLDYTNKAIKDGQLSPYERNVAGWLEYAGGLGGILNEAQGQFGKILSPQQMKAMYDSGFEWGEYMGAQIPWEQIAAPPPR